MTPTSTTDALPGTAAGPGLRSRLARGFTLLEVMLAFAILAIVASFVAVIWSENMDKAMNALAQRELREVADTVFRRILYEIQEHEDGKVGSLDEFYGEWTGARGYEKERWRFYTFELLKKEKVVAGIADEDSDADALFGDDDVYDDDTEDEETEAAGDAGITVILLEVTLHIRDIDDPGKALITLRTYVRPPDLGEQR